MANLDIKLVRFEDKLARVGFDGDTFVARWVNPDGSETPIGAKEVDVFDLLERGVVVDPKA